MRLHCKLSSDKQDTNAASLWTTFFAFIARIMKISYWKIYSQRERAHASPPVRPRERIYSRAMSIRLRFALKWISFRRSSHPPPLPPSTPFKFKQPNQNSPRRHMSTLFQFNEISSVYLNGSNRNAAPTRTFHYEIEFSISKHFCEIFFASFRFTVL